MSSNPFAWVWDILILTFSAVSGGVLWWMQRDRAERIRKAYVDLKYMSSSTFTALFVAQLSFVTAMLCSEWRAPDWIESNETNALVWKNAVILRCFTTLTIGPYAMVGSVFRRIWMSGASLCLVITETLMQFGYSGAVIYDWFALAVRCSLFLVCLSVVIYDSSLGCRSVPQQSCMCRARRSAFGCCPTGRWISMMCCTCSFGDILPPPVEIPTILWPSEPIPALPRHLVLANRQVHGAGDAEDTSSDDSDDDVYIDGDSDHDDDLARQARANAAAVALPVVHAVDPEYKSDIGPVQEYAETSDLNDAIP